MSERDDREPEILASWALRIVAASCKLAHCRHKQDGMVGGQQFMTTSVYSGGGGINLDVLSPRLKLSVTVSGDHRSAMPFRPFPLLQQVP